MAGSCSALRHSRAATAFVILTLVLAVLPLGQIAPPVAAQDTATYKLIKYNCNPGYDPSSGDANAAFSNCTSPGSGVTFTLQSGDASYGNNGSQQTDGGGSASWTGIPLGSGYSIVESNAGGAGDPWVYCEISGNPNNPSDVQSSFFQAPGGNMDVGYSDPNLTSYTQASCSWFNPTADQGQQGQGQQGQQLQGSGYATVYIQKYLCDQNYDYSSSNYSDYTYDCPSGHGGVKFSVNGSDPVTTDNFGVVEVNSLPAGETKIRLVEPSGYIPIALYCIDWDQSQSGSPTLSDSNATTWTGQSDGSYEVTTTLSDYHTYYCYWFDIPSDYGTVYLYKFYCDPNFDWQSNGYDYLFSGCNAQQGGVAFQIENGGYFQEQTTDNNGTATWSDVPGGTLSITESPPNGYQVGRIFCGYSDTNSSAPTEWDEYFYSDGWDVSTQTGKYLFCVVFDVPATTSWTIYLYKYYCDPSFDWHSGYFQEVYNGCQNAQSDVMFDLSSGSYSESQTTGTDGTATWPDVPGGDLHFEEQFPSGYEVGRVFCGWSDSNSTTPNTWYEYLYSGGLDIAQSDVSGQYIFCVIFDVPTTTYGWVTIYKYYCDASFDWENGSYDYLSNGCQSPQEAVTFDLSSSGGYFQSQTTDSSGYASWSDVPFEDLHFDEYLPDGYQVGRIFCGWSDSESSFPSSWDEYTYSGGWDVQWDTQQYLYCDIFDVPTDYGWVTFYKYYCDAGFDWQNGSYDYLYGECTASQSDVAFDLSSGSYFETQTTDSTGMAHWSDVPGSDWHFDEQFPDGYEIGRIFCGWSDSESSQPSSWDEYDYDSGWDITSSPGQYWYCYIFDIPTTYGWVTIYKYYCEADFDWQNGSYDYLYNSCTSPQEAVEFTLDSGSYSESRTTDSTGMAQWTDVPGSNWHFSESLPDGYQVGRIFCGWSDSDSSTPSSWDEYNYSSGWDISSSSGQYWYCYIFDVPTDYGWVTFYKYYCEADFDWQNGSYDYLYGECTSAHSNVEFTLDSGSYSELRTTDSSGVASWTDVPGSDWHFDEHFPDGYEIGRIFCGWSDSESSQPTSWDEYDYSNGWDITSSPGQYWYCYIFDIPTTYGWVTIYKYYCDASFDWENGSYDYLKSGCTSPQDAVEFTLDSGSYSDTQTTDSTGTAHWSDVPGSDWHFSEYFPDDYQIARIFCGWSDSESSQPTSWDEYEYDSGWDISSSSGEYWYCYVFDVPTTYGWVTIYKYYCDSSYAWQSSSYDDLYSNCSSAHADVDFDLSSGSYFQTETTDSTGMAQWADVTGSNWHFEEHFPDGYQVGRIFCGWSDSESSQPSSWDEYDYDSGWDISSSPEQYWYCYVFDVPTTYGWVTIFKYNCPSDFELTEQSETSEYDEPSPPDPFEYDEGCFDQPDGVEFELSNASYGYSDTQETASGGVIDWSDVPSGSGWKITEYPASGYAPLAVWCGSSSDGSDPTTWEQYTIGPDGSISGLTVEPDKYFICLWFNKPYDNPQVWIYKYNCTSTADWHWNYHQLLSNCTTPAPHVAFAYGPQGGSSSDSTTDDQGRAFYDSLEPGTWSWEETYPSGYDGAVVYCQWVNTWGSGSYQLAQLDGSKLWLDVELGDVVTCYWFDFPSGYGPSAGGTSGSGSSSGGNTSGGNTSGGNTSGGNTSGGNTSGGNTSGGNTSGGTTSGGTGGPPPLKSNAPTGPTGPTAPTGGQGGTTGQQGNPNAPATLVIIKTTCPEGYDLYAKDADVAKDCTELTEDIEFALTSLTPQVQNGTPVPNEPVKQTTDVDGEATWSNLKAGPYLIQETLPEGTDSAFIWTCKSDKRQFQTQYPLTPFSYAGPNGQTGITLIGGEKLECSWYNVPEGQASVTILKFQCPSSPVIVAQCNPASAGVAFSLTPAEGSGAIVQLSTDDSGSASGTGAPGAYIVAEQGGTPCLIDSDSIDAQGHVTLAQNETTEVKVYNCGGGS